MVNIFIKSKTKMESVVKNVHEITYFDYLSQKQSDQISDNTDLDMNEWRGIVTFIGDTLFSINRDDIESIEVKNI